MTTRRPTLADLSGTTRQLRRLTIRCKCKSQRTVTGADGEDVFREVTRLGWIMGSLKTKAKDGSEVTMGKCPVCIGLGK